MTLHRKTVLFLVFISILMFTAFYITSRIIVMSGFRQVELKNSEEHMRFTLQALNHEVTDIGNLAVNYSAWYDTYNFAAGDMSKNAYIHSNYDVTTYTENDLNMILIVNHKNQLLYGGIHEPKQNDVSPISSQILDTIIRSGLLTFQTNYSRNAGIISTSNGPMLIVLEPITTNTFKAPADGMLAFGRLLTNSEISDLALRTDVDTEPWNLSEKAIPSSAIDLNVGWMQSRFWTNLNSHDAVSYAEIMDLTGKPAVGVAIHLPRTILQTGHHTLWYFVVFLVFVSLGYSVFVLVFFESSFLNRIRRFMNGIEAIRKGKSLSFQVKITGRDEITKLEMEFNELMSSLEESHRVIQYQAYHDHLTGLLNRNQFHQILRDTLQMTRSGSIPFTLLFIDIDKFKAINDNYGHNVGDLVLKSIAERLEKVIGTTGSVARLGGDEFTALLPGIGGTPESNEFIISVINQLSEPYVLQEFGVSVFVSIGYSQFPGDGEDEESLVKAADRHMFAMKHDKFSHHGFSNLQIRDKITRTIRLEQDIAHVLSKNQLHIVYQPIVNTYSRAVVGVETLLRWNHPKLGPVSPAEFIPIAEKTSYMSAIGEWTLRQACLNQVKWIDQGARKVRVAVNISSIQFMSPVLLDTISGILAETKLPPELLELEITESMAMQNVHEVIKILSHLKEMGVRIAIDDFGTGYSSLSYLSQFPIDFLKIDKSFVDGMCENESDMKIVKGIIELAHSLHFSVIAEGVESLEQFELLQELHCDEIQGFLFGKPMNEQAFYEKLAMYVYDS
jgi:diguanylate cyclase (GGDEF)-like protein